MQIIKKSSINYELHGAGQVHSFFNWEDIKKPFLVDFVKKGSTFGTSYTFDLIDATKAPSVPVGSIRLDISENDSKKQLTYEAKWGVAPFGW